MSKRWITKLAMEHLHRFDASRFEDRPLLWFGYFVFSVLKSVAPLDSAEGEFSIVVRATGLRQACERLHARIAFLTEPDETDSSVRQCFRDGDVIVYLDILFPLDAADDRLDEGLVFNYSETDDGEIGPTSFLDYLPDGQQHTWDDWFDLSTDVDEREPGPEEGTPCMIFWTNLHGEQLRQHLGHPEAQRRPEQTPAARFAAPSALLVRGSGHDTPEGE